LGRLQLGKTGIQNWRGDKEFFLGFSTCWYNNKHKSPRIRYNPKKRINLVKIVEVVIPIIFFSVIGWIIYSTGIDPWNKIKNIFLIWFLVHGILSALGAAIARGHPLSIFIAFVAAPFTSLEPFFAPGWFAGLC
jgi:pheromone shutdown protein TraB